MSDLLTVVLPCYNEEKMILKTATVLDKLLSEQGISYELLFIDDGSKDETWDYITVAQKTYGNVSGVRFSRNFGKEAAVYAGLSQASGNVVAVMDCDLQHPPEILVEMYTLWKQGYEVIEGVKSNRGKESFSHKLLAGIFYSLISKAVGINMENASDFKMMDKKVVDALCSLPERNTFFRALSSWVGYKTATVYFEVQERAEGKSKWSFKSLCAYALNNITAFTAIPLQFATISGIVVSLFAIVLGLQTLFRYFNGTAVAGFTTIILLLLIIGSIIMLSLGIIGFYLAKIYDEIKHRPKYIISEIKKGTCR